jgi:hypothetical protein
MNQLAEGCSLIDSWARHRAHPDTWDHPTAEELDRIAPGWLVKIGLEHPSKAGRACGERFWCRVREVTGSGIQVRIEQILVNSDLHGLDYEDVLTVERRHVLDIHPEQLKDSAEILNYLRRRHRYLNQQLREFKRQGDEGSIGPTSWRMIELRNAGRFVRGLDPDDDGNPFGPEEDY